MDNSHDLLLNDANKNNIIAKDNYDYDIKNQIQQNNKNLLTMNVENTENTGFTENSEPIEAIEVDNEDQLLAKRNIDI